MAAASDFDAGLLSRQGGAVGKRASERESVARRWTWAMAALNSPQLSMFMVLCSMLLGKTARNSAWMGADFRASSSEGAVNGFDRLEDSSGIYNRGKMHKDKQSNTEEEQNNSEPGRQRPHSGTTG